MLIMLEKQNSIAEKEVIFFNSDSNKPLGATK